MLFGEEYDLTKVDLSTILTGHQMMAVNVAANSTPGLPLNDDAQRRVNRFCDDIMKMDRYHQQV